MKSTNVRWRVIFFIMVPMQLMMSLDRINISVSAPLIQEDFGLSLTEISFVLSAFAWTYALCQVPAGIWVQRIGSHKAIAIAGILWSVVTFITPFGSGLILLIFFRCLLGIAQAADIPGGINAINTWFPRTEKARANSIFLSSGYLGLAIGTTLTAWIISRFGWEWSFYSYGIIGVAVGLYWYKRFKNHPKDHPAVNQGELDLITEETKSKEENNEVVFKTSRKEWKTLLSKSQFWAIGFQYFCLVLVESFFITLLPLFLLQSRGLSIESTGIVAALPWLALAASVVGMGTLVDFVYRKTKSRITSRVPFGIVGFIISSSCLWFASQATSTFNMSILLMISMAGIGMIQVPNWSAVQDIGGKHSASLSGWVNFCGNAATAIGTILVVQTVNLTGNWNMGIMLLTIMGGLGAISWLFIKPNKSLFEEEQIESAIVNNETRNTVI
ncbi:MFS transporter [Peribacillus sp. TH16]|uniref:MFS transporter n=1 Tax=unclassified Peribacillus TaxID=2675266 RepID=UPI0019132F94|nr:MULTISPECIES: MFS transporter [unclassified Peribacillus]MBK5458111.1 MFS transporter [Peribacillus sp. TH27]MBK5482754.1 MFS transporter [Peribacillus sp. TH16]